jgi:hypothetical protein
MGTETCDISIGGEPDPRPGQYYEGVIDDLRIYNYALSDEEIRRLHNTAPAGFGPVIERTLGDHGQIDHVNGCIDFDSGQLFTLRPDIKEEEGEPWIRANGIDAFGETDESPMGSIGLRGVEMVALPVDASQWNTITPRSIREQLGLGRPTTPQDMILPKDSPGTYIFKTWEGGMGILQILEVEYLKKTNIRYKMLQREKAKSPIDLSTPEATIKSFVKAVYDGDLEDAKECISKDGHDYDEFMEMLATESNHPFQAMIKAMDASIPVEITSTDITEDKCKIKWYFTLGRVYYFGETKMKKGMHQKFSSYLELVDDKWLIRDI